MTGNYTQPIISIFELINTNFFSRETKLITAEAAITSLAVSITEKPSVSANILLHSKRMLDNRIHVFQYESLLIGGLRGTSTRCLSLCFGKCLKSSRRLGLLSLNFELR